MNQQELQNNLQQFTGTEEYYRYHSLLLTDGVFYLANEAACFWLIDVIWSHILCEPWADKEDFILCTLTVKDNVGKVILDDGNDEVLASQQIPFTDFPLDEVKLYLVRQDKGFVVMLPSEY